MLIPRNSSVFSWTMWPGKLMPNLWFCGQVQTLLCDRVNGSHRWLCLLQVTMGSWLVAGSHAGSSQVSQHTPNLTGVFGEVRHEWQVQSGWLCCISPVNRWTLPAQGYLWGTPDAATPRLPTLLFFQDRPSSAAAVPVKVRAALLELTTQPSEKPLIDIQNYLWSFCPLEALWRHVFTSGSSVCIMYRRMWAVQAVKKRLQASKHGRKRSITPQGIFDVFCRSHPFERISPISATQGCWQQSAAIIAGANVHWMHQLRLFSALLFLCSWSIFAAAALLLYF